MEDPPFEAGAVQETGTAALLFEEAVTPVGAPGTVAGVAEFEAVDAVPVPAALVAVTLNVYEVPLLSPVTVQLRPAVEQVSPPGVDVAV